MCSIIHSLHWIKEKETLLLAVTPSERSQINQNDKKKIFLVIAQWQLFTALFSPSHFHKAYITQEIQNATLLTSMILIAAQLVKFKCFFFFPRALIFYIAFFPVVLQVMTKALLQTNLLRNLFWL